MPWDEFLGNCGVHLERLPEPCMDTSNLGVTSVSFADPRNQALHDSLQRSRAQCLQRFVDEVAAHAEQKRNEYSVSIQMWDRAPESPAIVSELLQVMDSRLTSPSDHDNFCSRVKALHQRSMDEAWTKWYAQKHRWLEADVDLASRHTQVLRDEIQRLRDATRGCREIQNDIRENNKRVQHTGELHDIKQGHDDMKWEQSRRDRQELQLYQREVPEAQVKLEADRQKNAELEQRVQQLKRQLLDEEANAKQTSRDVLQQRWKNSVLEKQLAAHTCKVEKSTETAVFFKFRGNIKFWVERIDGKEFVRIGVHPPALPTSQSVDHSVQILPAVARGLLACAWSKILAMVTGSTVEKTLQACLQVPQDQSSLESFVATVRADSIPVFVRQFDVEALWVTSKIKSLHTVKSEIPEISKFVTEFEIQNEQPMLVYTINVVVLRSHSIAADGRLRPVIAETQAGDVDAVQCILNLKENLANSKWSSLTCKRFLGRVDIKGVGCAMQGVAPGAALREVVAAAVQAMRQQV
jgi:hypothetical protein